MSKPKRISEEGNIKKQSQHLKKRLILSCPHDGPEKLPGVPERDDSNVPQNCKPFVIKGDLNTRKLTEYIEYNICKLWKKDVYVVIGRINRHWCDLNRPEECAFEAPEAKRYYDEYHNSISENINEIHKNTKRKEISLHFDIHGMKNQIKCGCDLIVGTDGKKSIAKLLKRNPNALFDKHGLIKLLIYKGIPTRPSHKDDPEDPNFDGGETIKRYGSSGPFVNGLNQAIQLEIAFSRRNNDDMLRDTAEKIAQCIVEFSNQYI
jgi:hypothetical protein